MSVQDAMQAIVHKILEKIGEEGFCCYHPNQGALRRNLDVRVHVDQQQQR
jgi:hypothetical protein